MRPKSVLPLCVILGGCALAAGQEFRPEIPRAWDDREVERFELPLAVPERSPRYMPAKDYYALKVRPIYRTYPVYAPGKEPAGYRESLLGKEPEIIFDASSLHTKEDWIRAGKVVFESQTVFRPAPREAAVDPLLPVSKEGILPPFRPGGATSFERRVSSKSVRMPARIATRESCRTGRFFRERRA